MKDRNISIDVIKCIAAILITNSMFDTLYPIRAFATGGTVGNCLFFFASGFTIFLKPAGRFDQFYKKRINRIYPTIFAWALLSAIFFGSSQNMVQIILYGGGWFISCIMILYIFLYIVNKTKRLLLSGIVSFLIVIVWFFISEAHTDTSLYGYNTFFRWGFYFLFMLLGAISGVYQKKITHQFGNNLFILTSFIFIFYAMLYYSRLDIIPKQIEIISLLPLLGLTFYFYKIGNTKIMRNLYNHKVFGTAIKIIGGLCLEIYIVQASLRTDAMNDIFPLNIVLMFMIILIAAYILRCAATLFSQIFKEQDLNYKEIFRLY